jgi:hypothetical protein
LSGGTLSCTDATPYSIYVQPGTEAIDSRPYRLPETLKVEAEKEEEKLLKKRIIEVGKDGC